MTTKLISKIRQETMNASGFDLVKMKMTPIQAAEILQANMFPGQRSLRKDHIRQLAITMKNGRFNAGSVIQFAHVDGDQYLIDGQHRLAACVQSGASQVFSVINHHCDDMEEAKKLYVAIDRGAMRTTRDAIKAYGLDQVFGGLRAQVLQTLTSSAAVATGGCFIVRSGSRQRGSAYKDYSLLFRDQRILSTIVNAWLPEAKLIDQMFDHIDIKAQNMLRTPAAFVIMLYTYRYEPDISDLFWRELAIDDGLKRGDARKTLREYLMDTRSYGRVRKQSLMPMLRNVASAWNSFYKDEPRARIVTPQNASAPILVEGTPHDGKNHYVYIQRDGEILDKPVKLILRDEQD